MSDGYQHHTPHTKHQTILNPPHAHCIVVRLFPHKPKDNSTSTYILKTNMALFIVVGLFQNMAARGNKRLYLHTTTAFSTCAGLFPAYPHTANKDYNYSQPHHATLRTCASLSNKYGVPMLQHASMKTLQLSEEQSCQVFNELKRCSS